MTRLRRGPGCSPAPQSDAAAPATTGGTTMPATGTATYEWEIAPEPIKVTQSDALASPKRACT